MVHPAENEVHNCITKGRPQWRSQTSDALRAPSTAWSSPQVVLSWVSSGDLQHRPERSRNLVASCDATLTQCVLGQSNVGVPV
jgi:hypothetical protein